MSCTLPRASCCKMFQELSFVLRPYFLWSESELGGRRADPLLTSPYRAGWAFAAPVCYGESAINQGSFSIFSLLMELLEENNLSLRLLEPCRMKAAYNKSCFDRKLTQHDNGQRGDDEREGERGDTLFCFEPRRALFFLC